MTSSESTGGGLRKLNMLLEATSLLHSQLPLDSVLAKMIDHAIAVTDADRGLLQEAVDGKSGEYAGALGAPQRRTAFASRKHDSQPDRHPTGDEAAVPRDHRRPGASRDESSGGGQHRGAGIARGRRDSTVRKRARQHRPRPPPMSGSGDFLGVLYMDSKRPTAFSKLDRQILDALAADGG